MRQKKISFSASYLFVALAALLLIQYWLSPKVDNVSYTQFKNLVKEYKINSVVISTNQLKGFETRQDEKKEPLFPEMIYRTPRVDDRNLVEFLEDNNVDIIAENENTFLKTLLSWVVPALIFVGIWMFAIKKMGQAGPGMMTLGKHKAKIVAQTDLGVDFSSVAGQDEAKQELEEVIEFLKTPEKFTRLGAKIPKGILLVGPPGTGKTLMAKAVAGESGVPFFSISGSDFIEMFVGLGAARVRDLFDQAGKTAPCIVFIDELDALGKARGIGGISGGHDEREQTLNQLLAEMDGFETNKGVIILAATNRPEILDPALLRPGRFDRQILVDRPDLKERVAILKVHSKGVTLADSVDLDVIARRTPGFTGADLANLVNEATLLAVRKGKDKVDNEEFEQAIDRIIAGLEKKNRVMNDTEKKIVAYHETGHALVAAFTATAEKVHKITIVPRGIGSLGFTMQLPTEDRYLMSKTELLEKIDVLLGGRAAEELTFGEITTGAQNDLQKATNIARSMVTLYGMNEKLGHATYNEPGGQFLQQGIFQQKEISDETAKLIDDEVRTILDERMAMVRNLLATKKDLLEKVATALLEKETLESEEFLELVGLAKEETAPDSKAEEEKESLNQKTESPKTIAVVLLNLGGPERLEDVEPFLFNLFSDRMIIRLGPAFMQKTIARFISRRRAPKSAQAYAKIGGGSPLGRITAEQAQALEKELAALGSFKVSMAMRYWQPRAKETLAALQNEGIQHIIALPLYPHYSIATTGSSVADLVEAGTIVFASLQTLKPSNPGLCSPSISRPWQQPSKRGRIVRREKACRCIQRPLPAGEIHPGGRPLCGAPQADH